MQGLGCFTRGPGPLSMQDVSLGLAGFLRDEPFSLLLGVVPGRLTQSPYALHQNKTFMSVLGAPPMWEEGAKVSEAAAGERTQLSLKMTCSPRAQASVSPPEGLGIMSAGTRAFSSPGTPYLTQAPLCKLEPGATRERVPRLAGHSGSGTDNPQPGPEGSLAPRF